MATPYKPIKVKVALVTGGASGMGRLLALRIAKSGAQVAVLDNNTANLNKVAKESPKIKPYKCNIANRADVDKTVAQITKECGNIDRLVHAAAIMPTNELSKMDADPMIKIMEVNYNGTVFIIKAVLASMLKRRKGQITVFGSIAGYVLSPHLGAYSASKSAVNVFTEQLIRETEGSGVHIMLVMPSATETPLIQQSLKTSNPATLRLGLEQKTFCKPEDVVDSIEKAVIKGKQFLWPSFDAKWLTWFQRLWPAGLWKLTVTMARRVDESSSKASQK
jgi:short-subunit dehydrogenase